MLSAFVVPRELVVSDLDASAPRVLPEGLTREVAYLQTFTGESLVVIGQEGPAAGRVSTLEIDTVPPTIPLFSAFPDDLPGDDMYVSAIPLLPGRREDSLAFGRRLDGSRNEDLLAQMREFAHGEAAFQQHGTVDYVVPIVVGVRPWEDEHRAAPGDGEFNAWVNGQLASLHGISFDSAPPPANMLLWDIRRA